MVNLKQAGVVGMLEDLRDDRIAQILTALQTRMRSNLSKAIFEKRRKERDGAIVLQDCWKYMAFNKYILYWAH